MRHLSSQDFQSINAPHSFPISPNSRNPFNKDNLQLCVKSLFLGTNEFQHNISKNKDVPQSLIPGLLRRAIIRDFQEYDALSRNKKPYNLLTVGAIFRFRYEHDFVF